MATWRNRLAPLPALHPRTRLGGKILRYFAVMQQIAKKGPLMSMRTWFILAAAVMALLFVAPVKAAPVLQQPTSPQIINEVEISSTAAFTLMVMIDEVTTVAIPLQVEWLAAGSTADDANELAVAVSPAVLRTGFFSVTVAAIAPATGVFTITQTQPATESETITTTTQPTVTVPATATTPGTETGGETAPITTTVPADVPAATGPSVNTEANLRAGPSTDFDVVGSAPVGTVLDIVGQNSDGTWLVLANGAWIATFLVDNVPTGLPVVEPTATAVPPEPVLDVLTPTVTPTPTQ